MTDVIGSADPQRCADPGPQGRFTGEDVRCELSIGHDGLHRFARAAMRAFWSHAAVREPSRTAP